MADQPNAIIDWHFRLGLSSTDSYHFYFTDENPDTQKLLNYKPHSCDRYIDKYYVVKRKGDNGDSSIKEDYWIKHRYTSHEDYWILSIVNGVKTLHLDSDKKLSYLEICAALDIAGYEVNGPDAFQCIAELVSYRQYFIRDDVEIYLAFTAMPDGRYLKHGAFSFQANMFTDETELNSALAKIIVSELGAVHGKSAILEYLRQSNSEYAALFTNATDLSKYYSQVNQFDSLQGLHESDRTNSNDQSVGSEYEDFYNKHHREIIVSDELVEKMRPKIRNLLDKVKLEQVRRHENHKKGLLKCELTPKTRENMTTDQKVMMEEMEALLKQ